MVQAQVLLSPDDFADDLESLGRANGNIRHRIAGVPGVHDGQVMVRLKKKRFVILDYSIQPNEADLELASTQAHIKIPKLAGRAICSKPDCPKIGIPVCLYDSSPLEQNPLYMRVGLCFQCQRNLNEQRRSEKKPSGSGHRKGEDDEVVDSLYDTAALGALYKKHKTGMSSRAMSSGVLEGVRPWSVGYGFREMGPDLAACTQEAAHDVARLVQTAAFTPGHHPHLSNTNIDAMVAATAHMTESIAAAVESTKADHHDHRHSHPQPFGQADHGTSNEDSSDPSHNDIVQATYTKAVQSINKSMYLLSQWKLSWDAATSHMPTTAPPAGMNETGATNVVGVTTLDQSVMLSHDAIASAAAVAAMTSSSHSAPPHPPPAPPHVAPIVPDWPDNLTSLLLAADQSNDHYITGSSSEPHHTWHFQHERSGREDDQDDTSHGVGAFDV